MELGALGRAVSKNVKKVGRWTKVNTMENEGKELRKCVTCGKTRHLARNCPRRMAVDVLDTECDEECVLPENENGAE
jgi:hypothetical protein